MSFKQSKEADTSTLSESINEPQHRREEKGKSPHKSLTVGKKDSRSNINENSTQTTNTQRRKQRNTKPSPGLKTDHVDRKSAQSPNQKRQVENRSSSAQNRSSNSNNRSSNSQNRSSKSPNWSSKSQNRSSKSQNRSLDTKDGQIQEGQSRLSLDLAKEETISSVANLGSELVSETATKRWTEDEGKDNFKPAYVMHRDRPSIFKSVTLSEDRFASTSYEVVAFKQNKSEETLRQKSENISPPIPEFGQQHSSNISQAESVMSGATRIKIDKYRYKMPVNKDIEDFVRSAPQFYNKGKGLQKLTSLDPIKQFKQLKKLPTNSFKHDPTSFKVQVAVMDPRSPVRNSIDEPGCHHKPITSTSVIPRRTTSSKLAENQGPDAANRKHVAQDLPDMKVKISFHERDQINDPTAFVVEPNLFRCNDRDERKLLRSNLAGFRKMSRAPETSHRAGVDVIAQARLGFREDCRSAFRNQRIPTLRRSPAYILCPMFVDNYSLAPTHSSSNQGVKSGMASADSTGMSTPMQFTQRIGSKEFKFLYKHRGELGPRQPIQTVSCLKNGSFGSIRVDSLGIGHPRFRPWAPFNQKLADEVRCRILLTTLPIPQPRLKLQNPPLFEPQDEAENSKISNSTNKKLKRFTKSKKLEVSYVDDVEEKRIKPMRSR